MSLSVCLSVCLFAHVFLGYLESDWDTLWHKFALWPRKGSKTIKFQKKKFYREILKKYRKRAITLRKITLFEI